MIEIEYRELTPREVKFSEEQPSNRTRSEREAFYLLPESMKRRVELNPPIAFKGCDVYFPDIFFREERVCVEIDGSSHSWKKEHDMKKDEVFRERGFIVVRLRNEDTIVNVAFWQQLAKGLERGGGNRPEILIFINDLRKMIDNVMRSWTDLESQYDILGDDAIGWQIDRILYMRKQWKI